VSQVGLDLDFAADLLLDFAGLELGFVKDFEGTDEACGALAGEVDAAEFAFSEGSPNLEHAEVEDLGCRGLLVHGRL
jgi:hypothetical protein